MQIIETDTSTGTTIEADYTATTLDCDASNTFTKSGTTNFACMPGAYLCDTFTDKDGKRCSNHTMDVGPGWLDYIGHGATNFTIENDKAVMVTNVGQGYIVADAGIHDNFVCQCDITIAEKGNQGLLITSEFLDTFFVGNYIVCYYDGTYLWIINEESTNVVANGPASLTVGQTYTFTATKSGSNLTFSVGNYTISGTDPLPLNYPFFGIIATGTKLTEGNFDNFCVYPIGTNLVQPGTITISPCTGAETTQAVGKITDTVSSSVGNTPPYDTLEAVGEITSTVSSGGGGGGLSIINTGGRADENSAITVTYQFPTQAGSLLVCFAATVNGNAILVPSGWTQILGINNGPFPSVPHSNLDLQCFVYPNAPANTNTISIVSDNSGGIGTIHAVAVEITGASITSPTDRTVTNYGTNPTTGDTTTTSTTTVATEIALAAFWGSSNGWGSPTNGFTSLGSAVNGAWVLNFCSKALSTTQTVDCQATTGNGTDGAWLAALATFH